MFEPLVISELLKSRFSSVREGNVYYFADNTGKGVDAILEFADGAWPVEIKSSQTLTDDLFRSLAFYTRLNPASASRASLVYAGEDTRPWHSFNVVGFRQAGKLNT